MRKLYRYILTTVLLAASLAVAGQYSIDKVCTGATRNYRIDGEPNSTYTWKLTDVSGNQTVLPSTADTVRISWAVAPGTYYLSCVQHSDSLCDATLEIGYIEVFDQPIAYAGTNRTLCENMPVSLVQAAAVNYSSLSWSTSGDGSFNDIHTLNPTYTPGVNDILSGVQLTLTALGLGNGTSCQPAVSSLWLSFSILGIDSVLVTDATCGSSNGSITVVASGPAGDTLLYSIDDGTTWSVSNNFTNLPAGSYLVIVKNDSCEAVYPNNPVIVNAIGGPQILSVNSTDATCGSDNGSIAISALGTGILFSIDNGSNWSTDSTFTNLAAGSYFIQVKDSNCMAPYVANPVIIGVLNGPQIISVISINTTCGLSNGSISISASGSNLMFSINNGTTWQTDSVFLNLSAGSYTIRVKDSTCEVPYINNPVIISTTAGPQITEVEVTNATCGINNGSITITASGTGTILYSINNGYTWLTSNLFSNLAPGSYYIKVKDDNCEVTYPNNPVIVSTTGGPQIISVIASDATCGQNNGTISITASGSGNLQYSIDNGATWQTSGDFFNLAAGSYLVKVKDDYCETVYPANPVVVNTIGGPQILSVLATDATCGQDNGSINITATGTGTILYSIDDGANWQASGQFMNLAPGSYLIRIKDDHCEITYPNNPVLLNSISGPMITLVGPTNTTCGNDNGTISILASGGDSLMFSIDNGASWTSDSVFTNLPVGLYNILVKNKICITSFINNPVSISAIPVPEITSLSAIDPRCHNGSDGYAIVNVSGGTQPYSYAWNDPMNQVSAQATNLKAGIFSVVITDASGCQDSASVVISEPDSAMLSNIWITNNTCYGDHNGSIHVEVSGGAGPYTFTWANGFTGNHLENLAAGSYRLLVTDSRGCTFDTIIEVLQSDQLIAYATITSPVIVMGGSATIQVSGTGGTGPYSGTGTYFVNAGTYSFQITDSTGCLATASISVPDAGKVLTNDTSACLGDHIVLPLIVYNFEDIVLFHLNLMYNPNIMEFAGFRSVIPDLNTGLMIHPVAGAGTLTMDWSQSFSVTLPDSSQLLQLVFKAINPGTTKIGVYDTVSGQNRFVNSLNQLINVQYVQGKAEVIRPAVVEIIGANTVNYGQPLELMVMAWTGNPIAYEWTSPGGEHSDSYSFRIDQFLEQHEGFYSIKVLDYNGCLSGDTTFISLGVRQVGRIEVPNAFTPNNDGLNDSFLAYTNLDIKFDFKMLVFNKWGELIFESNDIAKGWDGTYKGAECQQDLYTWIIHFGVPDYIQMEQQSPLKGVVMLVK